MKKLLCFVGPQHHMPVMRPLLIELEKRDWLIEYYTANTEACFQVDLNALVGPDNYYWLPDFTDHRKARRLYEGHVKRFMNVLEQPTVLDMMLPQVLDRLILHSCEEWTATEALIRNVRPDVAVALHEINRWGVMLGYWSQRFNIPLFTMQEGLYYADPWVYTGHTTYGKSMVWGEGTRQKLIAAGCEPERVLVVGHPDLGGRMRKGWDDAENICERRKVVMLFFAHVGVAAEAGEQLLAGWPDDWLLLIKPHPLAQFDDVQNITQCFSGRENVRVLPTAMSDEEKFAWMARAEVCLVGGCSSMVLECLAMKKPLGIIPTANMIHDYSRDGVAVSCGGLTLWQGVQKILAEFDEHCSEKARAWVQSEAHCLNAASKMADVVEKGTL